MNLTNLFGKQVFSLYEGEIIGTIVEAIYNSDYSKVISLKIFDQEEIEYEIKLQNIKAISDCVIIANKTKLNFYLNKNLPTPFFKDVIDQGAKQYGKIIDCIIEQNGQIKHFLTDKNQELLPEYIYLRNNFIYYSNQKLSIKSIKPRQNAKALNEIKVNVLSFNTKETKSDFLPSRLQYNPTSLLGKVAKDSLLGINNEVIIKANQIITEKTLDDASRHNRLNQLYFLAV